MKRKKQFLLSPFVGSSKKKKKASREWGISFSIKFFYLKKQQKCTPSKISCFSAVKHIVFSGYYCRVWHMNGCVHFPQQQQSHFSTVEITVVFYRRLKACSVVVVSCFVVRSVAYLLLFSLLSSLVSFPEIIVENECKTNFRKIEKQTLVHL